MLGHGGTGTVGVLLAGLMLAAGLSACEYTDAGDPRPAPGPTLSSPPRFPLPTKDQATLALEASNLVAAKQLLGATSGAVILEDSGSVGGTVGGVGKSARVEDAGSYTVTAACVGASNVHLVIAQDPRTGLAAQDQTFDCSAPYARVVHLQPGAVNVRVLVIRPYSGASAASNNGGAAAVRVTAGG
ncbi:hypothetical protein [Arthrobacter sp. efr-133-TYG-118]|uniref:hypothetical protein n=1 Tax=Arthrobacter sp. efr-133-TYG-118 TaxID=3040279 RepID=UPI00255196B1|nr:hypothetical protein [Arthrobacter sp. efr-133-TYG-118]